MSLCSLILAQASLLQALGERISLAIALMALAMLCDMLDGPIARSTTGPRAFGTQLDSLIDVYVYLCAPGLILFQLGQRDGLSLLGLFAYGMAGVLRLAHFNLIGTESDALQPALQRHVGLPVIWSQLLAALAFPAWWFLGPAVRPFIAILLLILSALMISQLRIRKMSWYMPQGLIILAVASAYLFLHQRGIHLPR